jgi:cellulose synthase/poly-beta-1,6-N-acetylglucosamine synthase-like glycosyltransferase
MTADPFGIPGHSRGNGKNAEIQGREDIPITIAAKNEARAIGRMLESLNVSCAIAESRHPVRCCPLVVLDDCTDDTRAIAEQAGVPCVISSGGKVEAQRTGLRAAPFNIFADADILIEPSVIGELIAVMRNHPEVQVAFPARQPLPPRRRTPLARALYHYNQRAPGTPRWFSGKLFAIRHWSVPVHDSPARSAGRVLHIDDMYLSRVVVRDHGLEALHQTPTPIWFRAPETLAGMYAYYRRMRHESDRLDDSRHTCPPGSRGRGTR